MKPFQLFWTITRKFYKKSCFMIFDQSKITFDRLSAIFDRLIRNWAAIEISINSGIIFLSFSIDWAKDSTDQKCYISNSHLENSRTWILTLWNNILQTQISLLQLIHVYTYICNINLMLTFAYAAFVLFLFFFFFFFSLVSRLCSTSSLLRTSHKHITSQYQLPITNSPSLRIFCSFLWKPILCLLVCGKEIVGFFGYWAFWEFDVGVMN